MHDALSSQSVVGPAVPAGPVSACAPATAAKTSDFSFDDFLDIVNPLQHLPIVGTLYRAITGDQIKTPEKIAGDTLYGGFWGLVSSLADTAFQSITGKNLGDTVLALFSGHRDAAPTAVAGLSRPAQTPNPGARPAPEPAAAPDFAALTASLARVGSDGDTAQRAVYAYRRAYGLSGTPVLSPF